MKSELALGIVGQFSVLSALGSDYISLTLVNVKTGTAVALKDQHGMVSPEEYTTLQEHSYRELCEQTVQSIIADDYQESLMRALQLPNVLRELADKSEYSLRFDATFNGETHDFQIKFLHVRDTDYILMGCRIVDSIYTQEKLRGDRLEKAAADAAEETRQERARGDRLAKAAADAAEETQQERARGDRLAKAASDAAEETRQERARGDRLAKAAADAAEETRLERVRGDRLAKAAADAAEETQQERARGDRLAKAASDAAEETRQERERGNRLEKAAADADERTLQEKARGDRLEKAVADAAEENRQERARGDRLEKAAADAAEETQQERERGNRLAQAVVDADERTLQEKARGDRLEKAVADAAELTRLDKAAIRSGAKTLRKERMFLDVLCRDYTSVYYYDVDFDEMEVLKMVNTATAAPTAEPRRTINFAERFRTYCENYVLAEDRDEFRRVITRDNIVRELTKAPRFVYRYRVNAELDGHHCYEAQIVRVNQDVFDGAVLLAFHPIDEVVADEIARRRELENRLQEERESNEVLKAISWIYYGVFRIDLPSDTYRTLSCSDTLRELAGDEGKASEKMQQFCHKYIAEEYQTPILRFFDVSTLADRLQKVDTVATDFQAVDNNWHTARFIVKRRDENGRAVQVLYVASRFTEEQWREKNSISLAKEAERASQAKTDFLRRMSHDIRTPINGIIGLLHMEERFADDPAKRQECHDKILMSTDYLLSLVNNVLDIGKVESGELQLENQPFQLIPLLVNQLTILETQAADRGIDFHGGKEMSVIRHPFLIGSEVYLNRLLMNIANNALKYTLRGGSVTFYCTETACDGEYVTYEFICTDTGIGMSEEFQKHAFDAFSQEGKVSDTTYNGSGLGLSIVKKIVDQMGGTIELKSKEGVGTTFKITLTFQVDNSTHRTADGLYEVPVEVDVTGKQALLVDDNALNREIAEMVLGDFGLKITTVNDGVEAVEAFKASEVGHYDFIFMDVVMPRMNGLDATRAIRALPRPDAATVPILAMTANAFQDDIQQSIAAGMNAHLTKPLDKEKIKKALYTVMQK